MTSRTARMVVVATFALALGVGSGVASAQATGTTGTTRTIGTTGATGNVQVGTGGANAGVSTNTANATGGTATAPPRSAADQQAAADQIVQRATRLTERLSQLLDEARREADMIRVTCLNDKLTQADANLHTVQNRLAALQKAGDQDQRNHEFTVISVLGQKFQVLEQQANACVGQDMYETGPTKVVTEITTSLLPFENDPGTPAVTLPPAVVVDTVPPTSPDGS
jgi:hypothetical protein